MSHRSERSDGAEVEATWPNHRGWGALRDGKSLQTAQGPVSLWTVDCGELALPSGRLVACDPFASLRPTGNAHILAPQGRFPVLVTLADVSEEQDRSDVCNAYASIAFSAGQEAYRKAIALAREEEDRPECHRDDFVGMATDAGIACFVDDSVVGPCMPDPSTWQDALFENSKRDCWMERLYDPRGLGEGIANIPLPLAHSGENIILFSSGWGDGYYPVVGSFDAEGNLLAVHIDFLLFEEGEEDER